MLRTQEVSDVIISYIISSPTLMERMQRRQVREAEQEQVWLKNLASRRDTAALRANRQVVVVLSRLAGEWPALRQRVRTFLDQFATGSHDLLRYVGLLGEGRLAQALRVA